MWGPYRRPIGRPWSMSIYTIITVVTFYSSGINILLKKTAVATVMLFTDTIKLNLFTVINVVINTGKIFLDLSKSIFVVGQTIVYAGVSKVCSTTAKLSKYSNLKGGIRK